MIRLTKAQILLLHNQLTAETGGISGLRDEGLLESAIIAPFQTFDGMDMYPTLQQEAARLCFGLVKNHPFIDGNKRIGTHAMLVFLALNGKERCGAGILIHFFRLPVRHRHTLWYDCHRQSLRFEIHCAEHHPL